MMNDSSQQSGSVWHGQILAEQDYQEIGEKGTLTLSSQPEGWNATEHVPISSLVSEVDMKSSNRATVVFRVPAEYAVDGHRMCEVLIQHMRTDEFKVPSGTTLIRDSQNSIVGLPVVVGG